MRRILALIIFGVATASLVFASGASLIKMNLPAGKSMEGGIAVNPVTHKTYIIAECSPSTRAMSEY